MKPTFLILLLLSLLYLVECSKNHQHEHPSTKKKHERRQSGSKLKTRGEKQESVKLKKTRLERYVGVAPVELDFETDETPSCSTESEEDDEAIFPLIQNTGNTCAFDALLQTLLILEFKPFKRLNASKSLHPFINNLVVRFGEEKKHHITHLLLLLREFSRKFELYYDKDRARLSMQKEMVLAHMAMFSARYRDRDGEYDRMADPSEVADFFLGMLNFEETAQLEWQWTTLLDGRERNRESGKMLILRTTREHNLADILEKHLLFNGHQVEWRDEDTEERVSRRVEKKSVFTKIPNLQIFLLQRTWRSHQRISIKGKRTNFLSQRSINIPIHLPDTLDSTLKAAICVNTKSVPHYFVVLRDIDPEDAQEYFTIYDGVQHSPKVVTAAYAKLLINRMSIMLFYEKKNSNQISEDENLALMLQTLGT